MDYSVRLKISQSLNFLIAVLLVLVPFFAFLTIWGASLTGHYTAWRLFDEALLLIAGAGALVILVKSPTLKHKIVEEPLYWLIGAYCLLQLISGIVALATKAVSLKALGYGLIVDLRFLLFFIVCFIAASKSPWLKKSWLKILLIPAIIVISFGLLQHFLLPNNFLAHFGYNNQTILPYETINSDVHYIRIFSTLRGSNPLGAYLVIIVAFLMALVLKLRNYRKKILTLVLLVATLYVLYLSYSRSAWAAALLSALIVSFITLDNKLVRRWIVIGLSILIALSFVGYVLFHNNVRFENIFLHTNRYSSIHTTSDQGHDAQLKQGLKDVVREPLGRGPGTAGPASVYNNHPARIPENYFIQIAEEVGWLGVLLFLMINILVARDLWRSRQELLSVVLLASLVGISVINLFSQAWTDDTLSYIWWGLAGLSMVYINSNNTGNHETKNS